MNYYIDLTKEDGCVGVLFTNPEHKPVYVGTMVHTEESKLRDHPLVKRYAGECDFHFFFDGDELPRLYTVPQTEIGGYDSRGGLFVGSHNFELWEGPLYYIDREKQVFLITENSAQLLEMGSTWREQMTSTDAIEVFASRAEAERKYRIWEWKELLKEGDL
jgi:hypothetical protein